MEAYDMSVVNNHWIKQELLDKKPLSLAFPFQYDFTSSVSCSFSAETLQKSKLSWLSRSYDRPKLHIEFGEL